MKKKEHIYIGLPFFVKRVVAANIIQRFWRRMLSIKDEKNIKVIPQLRVNRANKLISKFIRNIIFQHRLVLNKHHSFTKSIWRET